MRIASPFRTRLYLETLEDRMTPGGLKLSGYTLGTPVLDRASYGDTWGPAWAADGQLYTPSDDTSGFDGALAQYSGGDYFGYDIGVNRLTGNPRTGDLHGVSLAGLVEYGPASGGCGRGNKCLDAWKATNMVSVGGVLYMGISLADYYSVRVAQFQHDASVIKSDNSDGRGLGVTWTPTHTWPDDPTTMWPNTPAFSSPYFVDYGQDPGIAGNPLWPDGASQYVYAVSTDGRWDRASNLYLGRVRRDQIGDLNAGDWSFVTGFTGNRPTWGPVAQAVPILGTLHGDPVGRELGWTSIQWVAPIRKYLLIEWYYPHHSDTATADWVFYQADHVWGPYTPFGDVAAWAPGHPSTLTNGDYTPVVPTAFMDTRLDTSVYPYRLEAWILTTGDFRTFGDSTLYRLTAVPLTLEVTDAAWADGVAGVTHRPPAVVDTENPAPTTSGPARMGPPTRALPPASTRAVNPAAAALPEPPEPSDRLSYWSNGLPDPLADAGWLTDEFYA